MCYKPGNLNNYFDFLPLLIFIYNFCWSKQISQNYIHRCVRFKVDSNLYLYLFLIR